MGRASSDLVAAARSGRLGNLGGLRLALRCGEAGGRHGKRMWGGTEGPGAGVCLPQRRQPPYIPVDTKTVLIILIKTQC